MKCPECSYNQRVKYGMTCGDCGYRFTFNPKDGGSQGMTDGKFVACIRSASQNGTMWYTENQLYGAYCRRMSKSVWPPIIGGVVLLGIAFMSTWFGVWPFSFILGLVGVFALLSPLFVGKRTSRSAFDRHLAKWTNDGKKLDMMLTGPALNKPPPEWKEPDIYNYGVERILIVERDILVDLLVKNGIHAEQRALILSESGYPSYLVPIAQKLLHENPDLPVFLWHDATPHGTEMAQRVTGSAKLPISGHPVTDIGMFPSDFQQLRRTKAFDPADKERQLPADALMLPFLALGLGATFAQGVPMATLLAQQQQQSMSDAGSSTSDFG